jgi:hypothetical protein
MDIGVPEIRAQGPFDSGEVDMSYSRKAHRLTFLALVAFVPWLVTASSAAAQATRAANLQITVVDQTNAVLPGATVTIVGADGTTKAATIEPVQTSQQGIAIVPNLPPGVYTIQAEFPGFETRMLRDVRIRAGDNKQLLLLPIAAVKDAVTVEQDKQEAASDPRGPSFGTTLTREQLEALSDDPNELRRQLQEMAGPGAGDQSRQLRRRGAAAEGTDPIDPHLSRSVSLPRTTAPAAFRSRSSRSPASDRFAIRPASGSATVRSAGAARLRAAPLPSRSSSTSWGSTARSSRTRARSDCS